MPRFQACLSVHTIRKWFVWMQISLSTEEKVSVFENTRLRVDDQIRFESATCGRIFFLDTEKKSPFSKIPGYVWTGPTCTHNKIILVHINYIQSIVRDNVSKIYHFIFVMWDYFYQNLLHARHI